MAKLHSSQHLPKNFTDRHFTQTIRVLFQVVKYGMIDKFKHKVETFPSPENFYQIHQVFMP